MIPSVTTAAAWRGGSARDVNFQSGLIGRVYLLRWLGTPEVSDVEAIDAELARARRELSRPLIYCAIVPDRTEPPGPVARQQMLQSVRELATHCEAIHMVIPAQGARGVLLRTVVRGMVLAAGLHQVSHLHASFESFVTNAGGDLGIDAGGFVRAAREKGLV